MNVYRDHTTPPEPAEDYVTRIEKAKRDDRSKARPMPKEVPLPVPPIVVKMMSDAPCSIGNADGNGLAMAPMHVVMA